MKMIKQQIYHTLRKLNILEYADQIRYLGKLLSTHRSNVKFKDEFPDFDLPPRSLAYDAYSAPDWEFYKKSGEETAKYLALLKNKYLRRNEINVLEWGCGPGRVIRHLPVFFDESSTKIFGTDYNPQTIEWCEKQINGIEFSLNKLSPPLPYESNYFDFIYNISVFTHLSAAKANEWVNELTRVLRPGGLLLITSNGDSLIPNMISSEKKTYESTGILVRGKVTEGKRTYLAVHSPLYMKNKLLKQLEILEHFPSRFPFTNQDLWITRK